MGTMTDEFEDLGNASVTSDDYATSSADRIVARFHDIDRKVNAMREQRLNDPDSLGDKLIKLAVPAITGMLAGHIFQRIWDRTTSPRRSRTGQDGDQGLLMSLVFAGCSAAFGAVLTQLSDRGSKAFVEHRHRKAARKQLK